MSPDICDASCIPKRVQCSARDLSEALAWHLQSCRKARQLAIAMTGSRFLEHPESHAKNVDVSQRKYSCKPSGKLRVRPWYYNPFWVVSLGFQALALPGYSRVVMLIYWRIWRSKNPIWMWKGCPGNQMKSWKVCSSQAASQPMQQPMPFAHNPAAVRSTPCGHIWTLNPEFKGENIMSPGLPWSSYTHPIWFRMLKVDTGPVGSLHRWRQRGSLLPQKASPPLCELRLLNPTWNPVSEW